MLSKNWSKIVQSLQNKKHRKQEGLFFVEGAKNVLEALNSDFILEKLFVTEEFLAEYQDENSKENYIKTPLGAIFVAELATEKELIQAGTLQSNNAALAVFKMKENILIYLENEYVVFLDNVQDPGNLGTIIRLCDWYGIKKLICTPNTVDFYNPKTIAATMGSFTRVQVCYCEAKLFFETILVDKKDAYFQIPVFGTFMEGENVHKIDFRTDFKANEAGQLEDISNGVIMMGNEANGISEEITQYVNRRITIPRFGNAESLNVGVATAIILDNLRR